MDSLPEDTARGHEQGCVESDAIWRTLALLPPRQRAVIVLRYHEHLSEAEIAAALGIAPGTVKATASVALRSLARRLADSDEPLVKNGDPS